MLVPVPVGPGASECSSDEPSGVSPSPLTSSGTLSDAFSASGGSAVSGVSSSSRGFFSSMPPAYPQHPRIRLSFGRLSSFRDGHGAHHAPAGSNSGLRTPPGERAGPTIRSVRPSSLGELLRLIGIPGAWVSNAPAPLSESPSFWRPDRSTLVELALRPPIPAPREQGQPKREHRAQATDSEAHRIPAGPVFSVRTALRGDRYDVDTSLRP